MSAVAAAGAAFSRADAEGDTVDAFTDEDCIQWLWSEHHSTDGARSHCPSCNRTRRFHMVRGRNCYSCDSCGHHVFPRVGTIFERSRVPLRVWFAAINELELEPDLNVNALAQRLGTTDARAKRIRDRIVAATGEAERRELSRIASTVRDWDQQWHSQGRGRAAQRASDTDLTRLKILEATLEVIVARGYSEVRVSDVALQAGVSTATVHYHFETKYELLFAALSNAMHGWFEDGTVDDGGSAITNLGAALRHAIVASPDRVDQIVWMDFSRLALRDARWAARLEELCLQWDSQLRGIIQGGVDEGVFRCIGTVDDAVMRIQGLIDGLAERVMLAYSDSPAERVYRLVTESTALELGIDAGELLEAIHNTPPQDFPSSLTLRTLKRIEP